MLKFLLNTFYRPLLMRYLSRDRNYHYKGLSIRVLQGVFHPGFFFSTKFLLKFLDQMDLRNKSLLELGAGSGLISFYSEKKSATVLASDVSNKAIQNLELNKSSLNSSISIIKSDLFESIPVQSFDIIIVNPPYYPRNPTNEAQLAWFCGENFEYFSRFFKQVRSFAHSRSQIFMVLSQDCDLGRIQSIAEGNGFHFQELARKKIMGELNFIFDIQKRTLQVNQSGSEKVLV